MRSSKFQEDRQEEMMLIIMASMRLYTKSRKQSGCSFLTSKISCWFLLKKVSVLWGASVWMFGSKMLCHDSFALTKPTGLVAQLSPNLSWVIISLSHLEQPVIIWLILTEITDISSGNMAYGTDQIMLPARGSSYPYKNFTCHFTCEKHMQLKYSRTSLSRTRLTRTPR